MLNTVNLKLFPSCYDCLSWSADGELAVAAGEYIHILTPKSATERAQGGATGQWQLSRFRVNLFTNSEWPIIYPQDRQTFSIGAEQSLSTVADLVWSPPGLAKHRRCALGVLTSNLILSFYEPVGPQGKWARVAILNGSLRSHFQPFVHEESLRLRKSMIRSFAWCPPVKLPVAQKDRTPYSVLDAERRWGIQLLAVTNDDNDVIFMRTERSKEDPNVLNPYTVDLLTVTSLHDLAESYSMINPGSLFSTALKPRTKALSISCGPWLGRATESQQNAHPVTSNVAVAYGTKMKIVKLDITIAFQNQVSGLESRYKSVAKSEEHTAICKKIKNNPHVTGPFQWVYIDGSQEVSLAAGILAGLIVISIPTSIYLGDDIDKELQTQEWPFHEETVSGMQTDETRHWEPISAMSVALNEESREPTLYLSTSGGYGAAKVFNGLTEQMPLSLPPWKATFDNYCEQFDIDRDLGGMVTGTVWGLGCHDGLLATAFTIHPKDMVEYRTAAEERTVLTFTPLDIQHDEATASFYKVVTDRPLEVLRRKREAVLGYILCAEQGADGSSLLSKKVIYAAACCVILESENEELLGQARTSLEWLATVTGADLSDEISKCIPGPNTIEPKATEQLSRPGEQIFEQCDVCEAGITWYSAQESQCASGHLFVRCNLTFLCIQEPGISKFCSECETEYLGEDCISSSHESDLRSTHRALGDAFDVCIYCGGKFQS